MNKHILSHRLTIFRHTLIFALGLASLPATRMIAANETANAPADSTFDLKELDQKPKAQSQARPVYPAGLHINGVSGTVTLSFIVDRSGAVRDIAVLKSTNDEFTDSAVEAVSKWKFQPGRKNGNPVNTRMQVPVVFTPPKR